MITGIEILKTEPVSGLTFGKTGAYEKVTGVATGELDPKLPMNKVIVDLDKAPRAADGVTADAIAAAAQLGLSRQGLLKAMSRQGIEAK